MKTRFLADADLSHDIVKGVPRRSLGSIFARQSAANFAA
jgi:hypothetical protein